MASRFVCPYIRPLLQTVTGTYSIHYMHMTAAHSVFWCQELYHLICEGCDNKTLSALSRISRDLQETPLDQLWSDIPNLGVLVRCMPSDLWEEQIVTREFGRSELFVSFRRIVITGTDWDRFNVNAARVKRFGFRPTYQRRRYALGVESYLTLSCAAQGRKLLPQVQDICWDPNDNKIYPFVTLLFPSTIQNLRLYLRNDPRLSDYDQARSNRMRLSLIPPILTSSPHLTQLTLVQVGDSLPDFRETFRTSHNWLSLQCLNLNGFPENSLAMLCDIPNLRELHLNCCFSPSKVFSPARFRPGLSQLEQLEIRGIRIEFVIMLTKIMYDAPLQSFEANFSIAPPVNRWVQLFKGMRDGMAHSSLHRVVLHHEDPTSDEPGAAASQHPLTWEDMSALLGFSNLTLLSLEAISGFDLDDEQIKILAKTLPHLEKLYLCSPFPPINSPKITLEGLKSVAQYCPRLKNLTMTFDATLQSRITRDLEHSNICNVNTQLILIDVGYSPIDDPWGVAAYLSAIFPNLRMVCCPSAYTFFPASEHRLDELEELKSKWKEVNELLHKGFVSEE